MVTKLITEKYQAEIQGVLNCYDRIVLTGNVEQLCYAKGMTKYLYSQGIRIFEYGQFAAPLRDTIRTNAEAIAAEAGLTIEFVSDSAMRKEARVQTILQGRGEAPGLVCILSAMEGCPAYQAWHDKSTHQTYVKAKTSKCLHYYFYFIDDELGLCYLRVPTWCPFRLQFYCNGHQWLAAQLRQKAIAYRLQDNAFVWLADFAQANALAANLDIARLQTKLDALAQHYCPVVSQLNLRYHWSIMQAEIATDIIFKQQAKLQAFYAHLLETLVHTVKPHPAGTRIATFLGRKEVHGNYQAEVGNRFQVRCEGRCLKHRMGPVSIKMYDKFQLVLRIETTVCDVRFFSHFRQVRHRDGSITNRWAPMQKTIYSLPALLTTALAANARYLHFISAIETPEVGVAKLVQVTQTKVETHHRYKGFSLLTEEDTSLFRLLLRGEFVLHGFTNRDLRQHLPQTTSAQISRLLKRLHVHALIKRTAKHYRYYLSALGHQVAAMTLKLRELVIIPGFALPA